MKTNEELGVRRDLDLTDMRESALCVMREVRAGRGGASVSIEPGDATIYQFLVLAPAAVAHVSTARPFARSGWTVALLNLGGNAVEWIPGVNTMGLGSEMSDHQHTAEVCQAFLILLEDALFS